jgi:hypothetical protein
MKNNENHEKDDKNSQLYVLTRSQALEMFARLKSARKKPPPELTQGAPGAETVGAETLFASGVHVALGIVREYFTASAEHPECDPKNDHTESTSEKKAWDHLKKEVTSEKFIDDTRGDSNTGRRF